MADALTVEYHHPVVDYDGKRLSTANIIWCDRDLGSHYYSVSKYAMRAGKFPQNHPCAPFDDVAPNSSEMGGSKRLTAFRERGYWASCFPEGDGITLQWWDVPDPADKTEDQVMKDISECFGWT